MGLVTFNEPDFDIAHFSETNWLRNVNVFNQATAGSLYWATCIAEEAGEVCGAIKKLERGFNQREYLKTIGKTMENFVPTDSNPDWNTTKKVWEEKLKEKVGQEMADVFTYLELAATAMGIPLWKFVKQKFNQVSAEMGAPHYKI